MFFLFIFLFFQKVYGYNQNLKEVIINKNGKLVEYIKHDTTLGREQNIGRGQESSLANHDILRKL